MYNVVLVDDEQFVIEGLKKKINWAELNLCIVGEANDGIEALPLIKQLKPDIILTDIMMPIMNGLELIENLQLENIKSEVILLTGHEEFEFARNAIRLDVLDYLLKPCGKQQIITALSKAISKLDRYHLSDASYIKQNILLNLIHNKIDNQEEMEHMLLSSFPYFKNSQFILCLLEVPQLDQGILNETLSKVPNTFCIKVNSNRFLILLAFSKELSSEIISHKAIWLLKSIQERIMNDHHLNLCIGLSSCGSDFQNISRLYLEAEYALNNHFIFGSNQLIHYLDCIKCPSYNPALVSTLTLNVVNTIKSHDYSSILSSVTHFYRTIYTDKLCDFETLCTSSIKFIIELSKLLPSTLSDKIITEYIIDIRKKILTFPDIHELINYMCSICTTVFNTLGETSHYNRLTLYVMNHVERYFNTYISLKDISFELSVTPNYLSSVFKNDTGTTFKHYLTQFRIAKSKILLFSNDLKINEISSMVGYDNIEYFSKTFKEHTGYTPSEYRTFFF